MYSAVQCVGQHAKEVPAHLRALIKRSVHSDSALRKLEAEIIKGQPYKSLIGTTQAIDLIHGGVKTNALPEEAWAVVNQRIATQRCDRAIIGNTLFMLDLQLRFCSPRARYSYPEALGEGVQSHVHCLRLGHYPRWYPHGRQAHLDGCLWNCLGASSGDTHG